MSDDRPDDAFLDEVIPPPLDPDGPPPPADDSTVDTPSWAPVDLMPAILGQIVTPTPTLLPRDDGACLLYPGLTHSIHGESESGKSFVMQWEAARLIREGGSVIYLDFESDVGAVVDRLRLLGAPPEDIVERLRYVHPERNPTAAVELAAWHGLLRTHADLVVIDGVTEALSLFGVSSVDNDELTRWGRIFPRQLAATGAAVVMVDHVPKPQPGAEHASRFAIGGQAKLAMVTGAAYSVEVVEPLGRGLRGVLRLSVGKDRPGYVRGLSGPMRSRSRTQETATFIVDSTDGDAPPRVTVEAWRDPADGGRTFRPTVIMERVSLALESHGGPMSKRAIYLAVTARRDHVDTALDILVTEGWVERKIGGRNAVYHESIRPFRKGDPRPESTV